jgi:hypothetical protein
MRLLLIFNFLLLSLTANAYFDSEEKGLFSGIFKYKGGYLVGQLDQNPLSSNRITHILVAGSAKGHESNQFFQSALARGHKYQELYPSHQVIIISSPEVKDKKNEEVFNEFKLTILANYKKTRLVGGQLVHEMLKFKHIASFDYYGHSSPWALILGKHKTTLGSANIAQLKKLRSHFTSLASASLNGCNGGLTLAPMLSKAWRIPVSGALSGSLFEGLHQDGLWYSEFTKDSSTRVRVNSVSFLANKSCSAGNCWRMKPSFRGYAGYWGTFGYGLGFYKFFCNFKDRNNKCSRAAALSLFSFPSTVALHRGSGRQDFEQVVFDYLCPTGGGTDAFYACIDGIKRAMRTGKHTYQPFKTTPLNCSMKSCAMKLSCKNKKSGPKPGTCKIIPTTSRPSTTFIDEYIMLMRGFRQL